VFDWGEFLQREFIWQRHWATTEKWGFYPKGRIFLTNEFLMQGGRGKNGIKKNTGVITMNLGIFGENFRIFWQVELLK
jgi:hypothetical protein